MTKKQKSILKIITLVGFVLAGLSYYLISLILSTPDAGFYLIPAAGVILLFAVLLIVAIQITVKTKSQDLD